LTDLCGNRLVQNDFSNTMCGTRALHGLLAPLSVSLEGNLNEDKSQSLLARRVFPDRLEHRVPSDNRKIVPQLARFGGS
jgi:hypothetical protein